MSRENPLWDGLISTENCSTGHRHQCGQRGVFSTVIHEENVAERTLEALLHEGVYLTLDEFRCRTEIGRGGRHIPATMADWDRSAGQGPLQMISSGTSGGKGLRTNYSLESARFGMAGAML